MRRIVKIAFLAALTLLPALPLCAQEEREQTPDVKKIVFSHIGDSYGWHITRIGGREIGVPLPVIVRGSGGWRLFSSARLENGASYDGFALAADGKYEGKVVETATGKRPVDLSITKNALAVMVSCTLLLAMVLPVARKYRKGGHRAYGGWAGTMEMVVMDVHDNVIKPCVGPDYRRYSPYLLTAFFFIFLNNLLGLVPIFPAGANVTGNIAVTLVLAVCTFLAVNLFGTKEYAKEVLWPDVPVWLKLPFPLMPAIEIFGVFTKPFALMIRLFANIMAGHAMVLGLTCLIFVTASMGAAMNGLMTGVAVVMTVFMMILELLVAYIQAYVFTMLSAVFIGLSRQKHLQGNSSHEPPSV